MSFFVLGQNRDIQVIVDSDPEKEHKHFYYRVSGRDGEIATNRDLCPHPECVVRKVMED